MDDEFLTSETSIFIGEETERMVYSIIWLSLLGIALLIPNVLAIRLALFGGGNGAVAIAGAGAAPAARMAAEARPKGVRLSPSFVRKGYLWKALSPLMFGLAVVLGLAIGDIPGYVIMGLGLVNLVWGFLGWDGYVPGKMGKR